MHLGDVFAGHGFDDEAAVVGGQEAVAEATLRVAVERSAPRQRVLSREGQPQSDRWTVDALFVSVPSVSIHLIVLVVDTETLPQVAEHHGTVLLELKATRQVFSGNRDTSESDVSRGRMRKRSFG